MEEPEMRREGRMEIAEADMDEDLEDEASMEEDENESDFLDKPDDLSSDDR